VLSTSKRKTVRCLGIKILAVSEANLEIVSDAG
jgi:hypothetical protein